MANTLHIRDEILATQQEIEQLRSQENTAVERRLEAQTVLIKAVAENDRAIEALQAVQGRHLAGVKKLERLALAATETAADTEVAATEAATTHVPNLGG